jgi:ribosomal-protein-alanine acetyltransferase
MKLEGQTPGAAHWSRPQYDHLFFAESLRAENNQAPSEAIVWIVEDEVANDELANQEKLHGESVEPVAFLVAHRVGTDWELENIAVALPVRRRGIATFLLKELIAQATAEGAHKIFLEVRASNHSARALYRKLHFEEIGLRKSYYSSPPEDAIICCLRCN